MARGWESKSVEAQQEEATLKASQERPRLTPEAKARLRDVEKLRLSLQSIRGQLERSRDPRHRELLERALADLDKKIREMSL